MATLLLSHSCFSRHLVPEGHPERPTRIEAVARALAAPHFGALVREEAALVDYGMAKLAHDSAYVDRIADLNPERGMIGVDGDTFISPGTQEACLRALGGAIRAVDAVFAGEATNAFLAARPPGHHAESNVAMGFCLFNTVAVAARHAQRRHGAERVAILDFDVHHGNGTQEIFWDSDSVMYASTHQMPLFPGTGEASERGAHGMIVNAPLREGDDGAAFRDAMRSVILPRLEAHRPDLVLMSAGFDAHHRDPLGGLRLKAEDFAWVTEHMMALAARHAGGRVVSLLEGGYDLEGLAEGVDAHVRMLMGA